jgi:large subunit ribosomal protein L9
MELILKSDVPNLGFKDDVVSVKNGYGRNYLIPHGLAVLATPSSKKVLAENIKQREFKEKKEIDEANKVVKKLAKLDIKIGAKSGTGGKLFGSIGTRDIADAVSAAGVEVNKSEVRMPEGPIRDLGSYDVAIQVHSDVVQTVSISVVAE